MRLARIHLGDYRGSNINEYDLESGIFFKGNVILISGSYK